MLAEQHRAIFISGAAVGAIVSARRQITFSVITARIENLRHFSVGRRILTHHVAHHVTEPEDAGGAPDRTLGKGEPIGELFKLGVLGNKFVKGGVQPHNTSHGSRFFRCGSGRGGGGTCDGEKRNSEDQHRFYY
jgi:hypothetical protein